MAQDQNIIQQQIDADLNSGKIKKIVDYIVKLEIDIDCEELLDAIGLPYERSEDDDTQNVITLRLDPDEYYEMLGDCMWEFKDLNEERLGCMLLNGELAEYCTKVSIYKPNGDVISFT